jgi:hypothetical protein
MFQQVRFKPSAFWSRRPRAGVREPREYKLYCGTPDCLGPQSVGLLGVWPGGVLARIDYPPLPWDWYGEVAVQQEQDRLRRYPIRLFVHPGLVEMRPGDYRPGGHAAERYDHAPRRSRARGRTTSAPDGRFLLADGTPVVVGPLQERRGLVALDGYPILDRAVEPYKQLALGTRIIVQCPRCCNISAFVARPSLDILKEIMARTRRAG